MLGHVFPLSSVHDIFKVPNVLVWAKWRCVCVCVCRAVQAAGKILHFHPCLRFGLTALITLALSVHWSTLGFHVPFSPWGAIAWLNWSSWRRSLWEERDYVVPNMVWTTSPQILVRTILSPNIQIYTRVQKATLLLQLQPAAVTMEPLDSSSWSKSSRSFWQTDIGRFPIEALFH